MTYKRPSSTKNTFCIQYWKMKDPTKQKVLRRINKDGVPISTKKYSEVFFYARLEDAMEDCRFLLDNDYDVAVKKCNVNSREKDTFWLSGS